MTLDLPTVSEASKWWLSSDSELRFYGTLAFLGGTVAVRYWHDHRRDHGITSKRLPPVGKPPFYQRPFRHLIEPLDIGGATADFYEQHLDILAMSGGYKTTLMASLVRQRLKAGRRVVVVTGGQSPALEEEIAGWGGWIIRPHDSPMTFNAWDGDKLFVAQGWAELLPTSSEIKVFQSCFELAVLDYLDSRTDYRVGCTTTCPRCQQVEDATHDGLRRFILSWDPPDSEDLPKQRVKGMKESYGVRLALLERVFGKWIGQELSVVEAVRQGIPLMFVLDASTDPDFNRFSTVLVWWGILHAVTAEGGFDVFVDELARLGLSEKLLGEQVRTFRVNDVHFVGGTHASDDLKGVLDDLIQLHVYGRMSSTATKTRTHAQAGTYNVIPASNFGRHSLKRGQFVVVDHEDRIQLGRVPTYRKLPNPRRPRAPWSLPTYRGSGMNAGSGGGFAVSFKGRSSRAVPSAVSVSLVVSTAQAVPAIAEPAQGPPEMPRWVNGPNVERKMAIYLYFESTPLVGCWTTRHALKGTGQRPGCEYRGKSWNVSDLVKALDDCAAMRLDDADEEAYLAQVKMRLGDRSTSGLSVQHMCHNKLCVRGEHLDWESKGDNINEFWDHWRARRATGEAA